MNENQQPTAPARKRIRFSEHSAPAQAVRALRARYDAAQTTDDNSRHWAWSDALSADAGANAGVRRTLRNRTRYEVANNSYARGITNTLANDCVGVGPRLQMLVEDEQELNAQVEADFCEWCREIRLAEKLRTMRMGRAESGETFGLMTNNARLASDVKLDLRIYEPEQVSDPTGAALLDPNGTDGIRYDDAGNPLTYRFLKAHPGDIRTTASPLDYEDFAAEQVLHFYRATRPGQRRGIPDLTPALPLFAYLRRFALSTIAAAETAAQYAAVIYSEAPPSEDDDEGEPFDPVDLYRNQATFLPRGYKLGQVSAEHPATTFDMFVDKILREIARCVDMPFSIAAQDSSKANMSAAYLDHQIYAKAIFIDRAAMELLLDRLFDVWLTEWVRVQREQLRKTEARFEAALQGSLAELGVTASDLSSKAIKRFRRTFGRSKHPAAKCLRAARSISRSIAQVTRFTHQWFWPAIGEHADPAKVAGGQAVRLASGLTTLPREYARQGLDWETEQASAAKSLGISVDEYRALLRQKIYGNGNATAGGDGKSAADDTTPDYEEPADEAQPQDE